ncbi:helix-turn-helix domain-containing protein [Streptomyces sp. NPDC006540]|uniref:helix-turn-helix domain-containing protein n=1 Tax=Streptomyces sp. NPDC006540 TaxID=3155353 RepID=UPI0033A07365
MVPAGRSAHGPATSGRDRRAGLAAEADRRPMTASSARRLCGRLERLGFVERTPERGVPA